MCRHRAIVLVNSTSVHAPAFAQAVGKSVSEYFGLGYVSGSRPTTGTVGLSGWTWRGHRAGRGGRPAGFAGSRLDRPAPAMRGRVGGRSPSEACRNARNVMGVSTPPGRSITTRGGGGRSDRPAGGTARKELRRVVGFPALQLFRPPTNGSDPTPPPAPAHLKTGRQSPTEQVVGCGFDGCGRQDAAGQVPGRWWLLPTAERPDPVRASEQSPPPTLLVRERRPSRKPRLATSGRYIAEERVARRATVQAPRLVDDGPRGQRRRGLRACELASRAGRWVQSGHLLAARITQRPARRLSRSGN